MNEPKREPMQALYRALLSVETEEECRALLEDLCTIKELQSMFQRFRVACLLDGGSNYIEVSEATGASSATISRVNRALLYGEDGYKTVIPRMKEAKE